TGSDLIGTPIQFDGGDGQDRLAVTGTPQTAIQNVNYAPGPDPSAGTLTYATAANPAAMSIAFSHLEPVTDLTTASTLTVNGTNDDNTINFTSGPAVPLTVATTQQGGSGLNEVQQVSIPPGTIGGTFSLSFNGKTTGPLAANSSAFFLQT